MGRGLRGRRRRREGFAPGSGLGEERWVGSNDGEPQLLDSHELLGLFLPGSPELLPALSCERCQTTEPALCCCTSSWTFAMQVVSFSEARESFKAVLDRVEADADVTLITRRHAQGAVVMSLDTYNSLMETVHLLRSPANAAHLQRSLEQAERVELLDHSLIDADQLDAGS